MANAGANVLLVGFSRYNYPPSDDGIPTVNLGVVSHGKYWDRVGKIVAELVRIRRIASKYDAIHCFALDSLVLARIALCFVQKPIVYQVQDIRAVLVGNAMRNRIARKVERWGLRRVSHIVVSSLAYHKNYFHPVHSISAKRLTVIENKLEEDPYPKGVPLIQLGDSPVTIGYFGVLRCPRSWGILTTLAIDSEFQIYIRGVPSGLTEFKKSVQNIANLEYGGPYRHPDELESLYTSVDLVWAAYPYGNGKTGNWKWARTVRFYEAGAFGVPVIVQAGTQDARFVQQYDIGLIIDMTDIDATVQAIRSIDTEQIRRWRENIRSLPRTTFVHSDEYVKLHERISSLTGR